MKLIINNNNSTIENISFSYFKELEKLMSYSDKSISFQLSKMSKNPYKLNTPEYEELCKKAYGCLLVKDGNNVSFPTGFIHHIKQDQMEQVIDNREFNGKDISLEWINKPFELRSYQQEAVNIIDNRHDGLICHATGLGKSLTITYIVYLCKKKTLIISPSNSIANQFYVQLCKAYGEDRVGYYGDGKKNIKDITIGIAASVNNHIDDFIKEDIGLLIFDEVQFLGAETFYAIAKDLGNIGRKYGFTATDFRTDGKDILLTAGVGQTIIRKDVKWGIASGYLAQPIFFIREINIPPKKFSTASSKKYFESNKLLNYKWFVLNNTIVKNIINQDINRFISNNKKVLIIVSEVEHGEEISKLFNIPFAKGEDKHSQEYIDQMNDNKISALVGTGGKIGIGTDIKNVEVVILANFILAEGVVLQNIGRGLRIAPGKTSCLFVDYKVTGSPMLSRHSIERIKIYKSITDKVKILQ